MIYDLATPIFYLTGQVKQGGWNDLQSWRGESHFPPPSHDFPIDTLLLFHWPLFTTLSDQAKRWKCFPKKYFQLKQTKKYVRILLDASTWWFVSFEKMGGKVNMGLYAWGLNHLLTSYMRTLFLKCSALLDILDWWNCCIF